MVKPASPAAGPTALHLPQDSLAYALRLAGGLIEAVLSGRNLTDAYTHMLRAHREWGDGVRGAVRDLAWGTLRDYGRGDLILRTLLHKPLPPGVHAVALAALYRLSQRPEQAFSIVDQAVDAIDSFAPRLKGVVNAVLRNSLRQQARFAQLCESDEEARFRHPRWWIARLRAAYPQQWQAVLTAGNLHPPMTLRVNNKRTDADTVKRLFMAAQIGFECLHNGALLLEKPLSVSRLPGFDEGLISVQDAGAQWAAAWLDVADGQRVLDACAAPGGKTAHILEKAAVAMTALEVDALRAERIGENLRRLGLQAEIVCADARKPAMWWDGKPFDRILADVPCSASGVVRRHPDIKWLRRNDDIATFARQQAQIMDALWQALASGGKMLYVTCSVFPEENRLQVRDFCARHRDAVTLTLQGQPDQQLLPNAEHDGFYYALLGKH